MKNSYVNLVTQKIVTNKTSLRFPANFVKFVKFNILTTMIFFNSLMERLLHFIGNGSQVRHILNPTIFLNHVTFHLFNSSIIVLF